MNKLKYLFANKNLNEDKIKFGIHLAYKFKCDNTLYSELPFFCKNIIGKSKGGAFSWAFIFDKNQIKKLNNKKIKFYNVYDKGVCQTYLRHHCKIWRNSKLKKEYIAYL